MQLCFVGSFQVQCSFAVLQFCFSTKTVNIDIQAFLGYKVHVELDKDNSRYWKEVFQ